MKTARKIIRTIISTILSVIFITQITCFAFAMDVETYVEEPVESVQEETQNESETIDIESLNETPANEPEKAHIEAEMSSKREVYVKHFKLSDGSMAAMQYQIPVHFEDTTGKLIDYDNRLIEDKDALPSKILESSKVDNAVAKINSDEDSNNNKSDDVVVFDSELPPNSTNLEQGQSSNPETINNGNTANPKENTYYKTKQSDKYIAVASTLTHGDTVRISKDGYDVSWGVVGSNESNIKIVEKDIKLEGDDAFTALPNITQEVKYENAFESVDLQYIVTPMGVKENIILNSSSAENQYEILYGIGKLHAVQKDKQTIELLNDKEEFIYQISAPVMFDQNGEVSEDISLDIVSEKDGILRLSLSVKEEWLKDNARKYPVIVDPTFYTNPDWSSMQCTYVSSANTTTNYSSASYTYVGYDSSKKIMRTYLKFTSFPSIEPECEYTNVSLALIRDGNTTSSNETLQAYAVTGTWSYTTVNWSNQPSSEQTVLDYRKVTSSDVTTSTHVAESRFDITAQAKRWFETPSTNKGVVIKSLRENSSGVKIGFYSGASYNSTVTKPMVMFTYRHFAGLEPYWTYHSVSSGVNGSANINDFTGNLVVTENIFSEGGTRLPVSISMVYNNVRRTYPKVENSNLVSRGWRPDFYMTLTPTDDPYMEQGNYDYVFVDGDGTQHYFRLKSGSTTVYEDEDGLGLTLQPATSSNNYKHTITDKNGTTYKFKNGGGGLIEEICDVYQNKITYSSTLNNSKYRLDSITDGAGRTIIINYVNSSSSSLKISSITRPDGKGIAFTYGSGTFSDFITKITYPDAQKVEFSYTDVDYFMSETVTNSNRKLKFQYDHQKVSKITECVSTDGNTYTNGDYINASYDDVFYSTFSDRKSRTEIVQFDSFGRTTGVVDDKGNIVNADYANGSASNNKLSLSGSSQAYVKNYISDPNVENSSSAYTASYWNSSAAGFLGVCSETSTVDGEKQQFLGSKSLKILHTDTDQFFTTMQQTITDTSLNGKEISISAYVKTSNVVRTSATNNTSGAFIRVRFFDSNNVGSDADSIFLTGTNSWSRIGFTTTVPTGTVNFKVYFGIRNAQGTAWFDCIQVEQNSGINDCNLLKNSNNFLSNWSVTGTTSYQMGSNSLWVDGVLDNYVYIYQRVYVNKKGAAFNLYATVSANSAPFTHHSTEAVYFDLCANIRSSNTSEIITKSFNDFSGDDQTISLSAKSTDTDKLIDYIDFQIRYAHNVNRLTLKKAMLTMDESGSSYTYDSKGNLISAKDNANRNQSYSYNNANELTNYTNQNNESYAYKYDSSNPHKLTDAYSKQLYNGFHYDYDSAGNVTNTKLAKYTTSGTMSTSTSTNKFINQAVTYTTDKNNVKKVTAPNGGVTEYIVDNTRSLVSGSYDPNNYYTQYNYDSNNYQITKVTRGGQSVEYTYSDSDKKLTKIKYGGMNYNFKYDKWDNLTSVDADRYNYCNLVTNTYDSYGDTLTKSAYANNQKNSYTYDNYDRVTKKTFLDTDNSSQTIAEYKYNNQGG
ncbi:MAG: DNRLRE domain-containing protein, partial [Clostridiales bacterium]|nr:DNRLRE domain-containing protein [Clostridiales bacterium]